MSDCADDVREESELYDMKIYDLETENQSLHDKLNAAAIFAQDVRTAVKLPLTSSDQEVLRRLRSMFKQWEQFYSPAA